MDLDAFNHRLATTFGADYVMRFDAVAGRWALDSLSAGGKPITQYWCRFHDGKGNPIDPDPATGLHPFRDLDAQAQEEIVRNLHTSYVGRTGDGLKDWTASVMEKVGRNLEIKKARRRARAEGIVNAFMSIAGTDLKYHSGSRTARRIARDA